jgi:foldase protein PrsA
VRVGQDSRRLAALVLGVALVVTLGAFVVAGDVGDPSIPEGEVAIVEDAPEGAVTQEEFEASLGQAAFNLQLREPPPPDDPQYEQVKDQAMSSAIQTRWVRGEAAERGIEVTERDVDQALETIIDEQLGGQKGYERFLEESPFDEEGVREVAELTAISDRLQQQALPEEAPDVPESDIQEFYEANLDQFTTPETRDVRVIQNPDEGQIGEAQEALEGGESFGAVAKEFSTDQTTRGQGGLRRDVAEGQNEPALDEAIFGSPVGELVGPIQGETGFSLIQVEEVTPSETTPLSEVSEQIRTTLQQGLQSQAVERFRTSFIGKWQSRTFCADDYVVDLCANADPPPDACAIDDETERSQADPATLDAGCAAFAAPRNVVSPGTGALFPGEQLPALPQGPPVGASQAQPVPGGLPIGPGGAPAAPGAPQGAPPAAPPGG